jgi:hypothetical protein
MRRIRPLLLLALAALALLSLRETQRVSACPGGYDPRTGACDTRSFQAPRPVYMGRRDVLLGAVAVALVGAATAVLLRRLALRRRGER